MKKQITFTLAFIGLLMLSCQNNSTSSTHYSQSVDTATALTETDGIAFTVAENYFVKKGATQPDAVRIETQADFDKLFGMATTMGENGKPTAIDFTKQNVIAVIDHETDRTTTLKPIKLERDEKGELVFRYKISFGEKQSYTTIPNLIIVFDKAEQGNVYLIGVK